VTCALSLAKVVRAEPGWYRGDFHAHTNFSDGSLTPPQLVEVARAEGLDFFAITDHNRIEAFPQFGDTGNFLVIPGMEITRKVGGDFNVFGMEGWRDWMRDVCLNKITFLPGDVAWTPNEMLERTAADGLFNSINHPLLMPWAWLDGDTDLRNVHGLEIWNDPSWPDNARDNPRAVALWTNLLNAGHRIVGLGGSDYHKPVPTPKENKLPDRLGAPRTFVYARLLSGEAVLEGVWERRVYVSMGPRANFQAEANGRVFDIGSDLGPVQGSIELTARAWECPEPAVAQIVRNGKPIAETPVVGGQASLKCQEAAEDSSSAWYRFGVFGPGGQLRVITNPIFVGPRRAPEKLRFGEFVDLGDLKAL